MKRTFYILSLFSCLLTAVACTDDLVQQGNSAIVQGDKMILSFSTAIPDVQEVSTRSVDPDGWGIQTLWLFTFDEEGVYLGRSLAQLANDDVMNPVREFTATVSSRTRIIHLLANQNLDGVFDDNANLGVHENAVMTSLVSTSGRMIYWGRYADTDTADGERFAANFKASVTSTPIPMYRNQAKFSYAIDAGVTGLEINAWAICNTYVNGTSVPFNSAENAYDWEDKWIETPYVTTPIDRSKITNVDVDTETDKYIFETPNSGEDEIYLIFEITKEGASSPRYYKVALIDENKDPLEVYRNYHYTVHFAAVPDGNGSGTFAEACETAPINNTWVSVDASIPSIGNNETGILTIEGETTVIYTTDNEKVSLTYTYDPLDNEEPGTPEVTWFSNDGVSTTDGLDHSTETSGDGKITGTISFITQVEESTVHRGTIQIKVGPLVRYINVVTVSEFSFQPVWCSWGVYNGEAGEDVSLTFTIPDTYPEELLPVRCLITTTELSGNGAVPLEVIYPTNPDGTPNEEYGEDVAGVGYKYVYQAEYTGTHRIYFQTNYATDATQGAIKLEAENFATVDKTYTLTNENHGQLIIANAYEHHPDGAAGGTAVYYTLVPRKTGSEVTFELRQKESENSEPIVLEEGTRVVIYTSYLKPAPGEEHKYDEGVSSDNNGHYYVYTTDGTDNLKFVTTQTNSEEVIRFSTVGQDNAIDYKSTLVELANYREWEFDAGLSVDEISYEVGSAMDISFDVRAFTFETADGSFSTDVDPGSGFNVYIATDNLEPAAGETRLTETADGYSYRVTETDRAENDGRITLHFRTKNIVSAESITLSTDESIAFTSETLSFTNVPLIGSIGYGSNRQPLPTDAFVSLERQDGTRIGVVTLTENGSGYSITLRGEYRFTWNEQLYMKSTIDDVSYECATTLEALHGGATILLASAGGA